MRYVLIALLSSLGGLMFCMDAIAQDVTTTGATSEFGADVFFNGTVDHACEFNYESETFGGTLVPEGNGPIFTVLSSQAPGGSSALLDLLCNDVSDLSVEEPIQVDGPFVEADTEAFVIASGIGTTTSSGSPLEVPAGEEVELVVDMNAQARDTSLGFPPANYKYKVTLTVSPR